MRWAVRRAHPRRRERDDKMKNFSRALAIFILGAFLYAGSVTAGVGFRVGGGFDRILYGDYNDFIDQLNDVVLPAHNISGKLDNIHWAPEFRGEVLFSYLPRTTIGLGFGFISAKSRFSLEYSGVEAGFEEHTVKAYPVYVTAYVSIPAPFMFMKPYVFGGGGLYPAKITFDQTTPVDTSTCEADLDKTGFGLHGGVGFEVSIAPKVAFDFEFFARWAKIDGFKGTATWGDGTSQEVFLTRCEKSGLLRFGWAAIEDRDAYEEGAVDLSGFGFSLGLKVQF